MSITLGFYGFARTLDFDINRYMDIYPGPVDIFIVIPDQLGEFDKTPVTEEMLRSKFIHPKIKSVTIELFNYDAAPFIKRSKELQLPLILPSSDYHPYRIISAINSITQLAKIMTNIHVDAYVLTRIDLIPHTHQLCNLTVEPHVFRGSRTCPYVCATHFEDRIIICGSKGIKHLSKFYDNFPRLSDTEFGLENIIYSYITQNNEFAIQPQDNIILATHINSIKYTDVFRAKVNEIYNTVSTQ